MFAPFASRGQRSDRDLSASNIGNDKRANARHPQVGAGLSGDSYKLSHFQLFGLSFVQAIRDRLLRIILSARF